MNYIDIAKRAHKVYQAYCEAVGQPKGDPWDKIPKEKQVKIVDGVVWVLSQEVPPTPEQCHEHWMATMVELGYINRAPYTAKEKAQAKKEKRPLEKISQCMRPWENLPAVEQGKDYVFLGIVLGLRDVDA